MQTPVPLSPSPAPANPRNVKILDIASAYLDLLEADQEVVVYFNYPDSGLDNVMSLIPNNSEFGLNRITPLFVLGLVPAIYHEGKTCVWTPPVGLSRVQSREDALNFVAFIVASLIAAPALNLPHDVVEKTVLFPGETSLAAMYQGETGPAMMSFPEEETRIQLLS